MSPLADVERLVVEGRYGRADLALRRLEALIPGLAGSADDETLLLALHGRAVMLRQLGAGTQNAIAACDVLERAAHERQAELWAATACALRARFRVDAGDIGGATADLARAEAQISEDEDPTTDVGHRLLDSLALVYAGLRLHDRADEVRQRIERTIATRPPLEQAQQWGGWAGELAARAMEPLAGGAPEPQHELMGRAVEIAAKLDDLPDADVPATLRRGARGVRALAAAYRGRPSEALRLLGPDAFGTVGDLPLVERQIVSLAAMRAHALVGSLATARSLDDAAATPPATLPNLVLEVCRTRERLWLETYAGGDVIPVLHRMTELLVRLGWRGMDLVADTARQALEHQALRTESRTDALTGVGNRRALDEEMRQLLRFGPLPLALILVDIDHFKEVNDRFTHVVGDEVLRRVAAGLASQLRTDDQLVRYGGDEFVVLLPATGDEEANAVAGRMAHAVASRPWQELAGGLSVTVTMGVAAVWSLSGRRPDADAEKLFRRADERLLDAKRTRSGEDGRTRGSALEEPLARHQEVTPEPAAGQPEPAALPPLAPPEPEPELLSQRTFEQHPEVPAAASPAGRPIARGPFEPFTDTDIPIRVEAFAPPEPGPDGAGSPDSPPVLPAGFLGADRPRRPRTVFDPEPYTGAIPTSLAGDPTAEPRAHGRRAQGPADDDPADVPLADHPLADHPLADHPLADNQLADNQLADNQHSDPPLAHHQHSDHQPAATRFQPPTTTFPAAPREPAPAHVQTDVQAPESPTIEPPPPAPQLRRDRSAVRESPDPYAPDGPLAQAPLTPARPWATPWSDLGGRPEGPPTAEQEAVDVNLRDDRSQSGRPRRDPFGPPTSRQAIIDLSARKRPTSR